MAIGLGLLDNKAWETQESESVRSGTYTLKVHILLYKQEATTAQLKTREPKMAKHSKNPLASVLEKEIGDKIEAQESSHQSPGGLNLSTSTVKAASCFSRGTKSDFQDPGRLTMTCHGSSRESRALFYPHSQLHICDIHSQTHTHTDKSKML